MSGAGIDLVALEEALAAKQTLPHGWYYDPDVFELELEHIFRRGWQYAGPCDQISSPNDIMVCQIANVPVVVTRDREGVLRAFVNMCRHRGFPVAREDCSRRTMTCAYHGWTYELDGRLRTAPRSEHEGNDEFDKSSISLMPVSVDTWKGFVWVSPNPDAGSFVDAHPELADVEEVFGKEPGGFSFEHLRAAHQRHTFDIPVNWKIAVENLIECYHCPTIHRQTFSSLHDLGHDSFICTNRRKVIQHFAPRKDGARTHTSASGTTETADDGMMVVTWPGSYVYTEGLIGMASAFIPTGPESTRQVLDIWARSDLSEDFATEWIDFHLGAVREDIEAISDLQPGLKSRAMSNGTLLPGSESAVAHFHHLYFDTMSEALSPA
jgi:choline monooxygenase